MNKFLYILQNINIIKYTPVKEYILKKTNKWYILKNWYIFYEIKKEEKLSIIKEMIIDNRFLFILDSRQKTELAMNYIENLEELWTFGFNPMYLLYNKEEREKRKQDKIKKLKKKEKIKKFLDNKDNKNFISIDIEDINSISILDVLNRLWIEFKEKWDSIILFENWNYTDWWRWNIKNNIINDFSGKGRPHWGPFNFVKEYLKLSNSETFKYFKENTF